MKLYHGVTSVCSIKVRLCLAELELAYESEELDLQKGDQHAPDYLALNPDGVVPTLIDDGLVLVESSLIVEYLDREYNGSALMPQDRKLQAQARLWLLRCLDIHAAVNTLTFSTVGRDRMLAHRSAEEVDTILQKMPNPLSRQKRRDLLTNGLQSDHVSEALNRFRRTFSHLDGLLSDHAWLTGPDFGITDIALLPYVDRLARLGFDGMWSRIPSVGNWLEEMQSRSSYAVEVGARLGPAASSRMYKDGQAYWPEVRRLFFEQSD